METINPNNQFNNNGNVQPQGQPMQQQYVDPNVQQQPMQQAPVQQPVQQNIVARPSAQYALPTAAAGQPIAKPMTVKAQLNKASSRSVTDTNTGEVTEYIVLEFEGFPTAVVRTMKQAQGDLIEQYTKEQLNAMSSTLASASYNRYFKGKAVTLTASYHEVGAIHTVDENSSLFKSGQAQLGAQVPTTTAGIWVDGFLSVEQTQAELDEIIRRELEAITNNAKANAGLLV